MTTTLRFRAALAATVLAPVLLAGCASAPTDPIPVEQDGGTGATDPLTLSYPPLTDAATAVPRWRGLGEDFSEQLASWDAACVPADVATDDACDAGLDLLVATVNGIHQEWWALDNANWESGEYSGLVALTPTRDATLAAKESGGALSCDSDDFCVAAAEAFHADPTALDGAFTAWRG